MSENGVKPDASMRWCWEPAPRTAITPVDGRDFRLRFSEGGYPELVCSVRALLRDLDGQNRVRAAFWYVRDRFVGGPEGLDNVVTWDAPDGRSRIVQLRPKIAAEVGADDAEDSEPT